MRPKIKIRNDAENLLLYLINNVRRYNYNLR